MNIPTYTPEIFVSTFNAYASGFITGDWQQLKAFKTPLALWHAVRKQHGGGFGREYMLQASGDLEFDIPECFTPRLACILWAVANHFDFPTINAYLHLAGLDTSKRPAEIIEDAQSALAGTLSEVDFTTWPTFEDWTFKRFLQENPGAAEYENYLDGEAIHRTYSCYYEEYNGFIFNRNSY